MLIKPIEIFRHFLVAMLGLGAQLAHANDCNSLIGQTEVPSYKFVEVVREVHNGYAWSDGTRTYFDPQVTRPGTKKRMNPYMFWDASENSFKNELVIEGVHYRRPPHYVVESQSEYFGKFVSVKSNSVDRAQPIQGKVAGVFIDYRISDMVRIWHITGLVLQLESGITTFVPIDKNTFYFGVQKD